jgi:hypothetical protein
MKNVEVARQLQQLRSLMKTAIAATTDLSLQAHWARYFCVLTAGVLENAITEIYSEFVQRVSHPAVVNYAVSRLKRIQNPKADKFVETARSFSQTWADSLEAFLAIDGRKDAIDSIMNLRHQIAHGKNVGVSVVQIRDYIDSAEEVLEFIEGQVRP